MGAGNTLAKKAVGKAGNKAVPVLNIAEVVKEITAAAKEFAIICEQEETKRVAIKSHRDVQIANINAQKIIILKVLESSCEERRLVIEKEFEVIDKALLDGNIEMLQTGLGAVVKVIESSPIANFGEFSALYNDNTKVIEI